MSFVDNVTKEQRVKFKLERLEDQWEMAWRQRTHVTWLEKGDPNTSYFHSCATETRKHNAISRLKGGDGAVVEGEEGLQALVTIFFNLRRISECKVVVRFILITFLYFLD